MFTVIHNALTYDLSNSLQTKTKRADYEMFIGPCYFVIFCLFVSLPIILHFYSKEINRLIELMLSTDQENKEQARKKYFYYSY